MRVRPPAVAGSFYPADPDRLLAEVRALLADAAPCSDFLPKAIIAPHAGYAYSGSVAAKAFSTIQASADAIKRVVLIGPAHYLHVAGIAVPTVDAFRTPLGPISLDKDRPSLTFTGFRTSSTPWKQRPLSPMGAFLSRWT
jgi:MEMO1 family protein